MQSVAEINQQFLINQKSMPDIGMPRLSLVYVRSDPDKSEADVQCLIDADHHGRI